MESRTDRRRGISQSPLSPALHPQNVNASPLSFSRSAATTSLSAPYAKRRCVSTGSIPSADDPFSNASHSSEHGAAIATAAVRYPALPSAQAHRSEDSPSSNRENTLNDATMLDSTPSRPSRIRNRTVSDTQQLRIPSKEPRDWIVSENDTEIEYWVRYQLTEIERNETGVGNNYTFEATLSDNTTTPRIRLVKIGYTSKRPRVRAARIHYECGDHELSDNRDDSITAEEQEMPSQDQHQTQPTRPVRLFRRVEKLAHAHLKRHLHIFTCKSCGREHREYFAVDLKLTHAVHEVWRDFVLHEPYDSKGNLTPFWEARLKAWSISRAHSTSIDGEDSENIFYRQLQHWNSFAHPYFLEFLWYDLSSITSRIWRRKWQALVFLQGFIIACLAFPSLVAFVFFAGLALAILVEACLAEEKGLGTGTERLYSISGLENGAKTVVKMLTSTR